MNKWPFFWLLLASVAGMALFLGAAQLGGGLGFPLDDAWIHQTYARNLAENGRWEFVPGVVSSGSTAPLWTFLLAVGYLLRLPYLLWAYFLGATTLVAAVYYLIQLWQELWPAFAQQAWLVGFLTIFTWPLLWAAASGMETMLFIALGLAILLAHLRNSLSPFKLGLLCGLLMLTRPDGLILILLILPKKVVAISKSRPKELTQARAKRREPTFGNRGYKSYALSTHFPDRKHFVGIIGGLALLLIPYFAFNWWSSGHIWPNTFYAKQAEYAALLTQPLLLRFAQLGATSLGTSLAGGMSSVHLLLVPGLLFALVWLMRQFKQGAIRYLLPLFWAAGHILLYAWRLPLDYQHGRYLLPTIPIWILYGLAGWLLLLARLKQNGRLPSIIRQTAALSYGVITLFFLLAGAQAYAQDVAFIEGEMVATARWLAENTADDALVATHDIGAIGYFAERSLLDLAGLLTPERIPLLTDQAAMVDYALTQGATYFVTAPGWPYPAIEARGTAVYSTNYPWTVTQGRNNMTIYAIDSP